MKRRHIIQALLDTEVQSKLNTVGLKPVPGTPEAMREFIEDDTSRWSTVIQKAGITFD